MPIDLDCGHGFLIRIVRDLISFKKKEKSVRRYILKFLLLVYEKGDSLRFTDVFT